MSQFTLEDFDTLKKLNQYNQSYHIKSKDGMQFEMLSDVDSILITLIKEKISQDSDISPHLHLTNMTLDVENNIAWFGTNTSVYFLLERTENNNRQRSQSLNSAKRDGQQFLIGPLNGEELASYPGEFGFTWSS